MPGKPIVWLQLKQSDKSASSMLHRHTVQACQHRPCYSLCHVVPHTGTARRPACRPQAQPSSSDHIPPGSNERPDAPLQASSSLSSSEGANQRTNGNAAAGRSSSSSSARTNGGLQEPAKSVDFQPRLLTIGLQRAANIQALQAIWQNYQHQFNSYHFSALMQQLTRLHDQVTAGLAQGSAQQQEQQQQMQQSQQDRNASLAELEKELGHLLDSSPSSSMPASSSAAAAAAAAGPRSSSSSGGHGGGSSSGRRARRVVSSRGLAELCPALDGYEHLSSSPPAGAQQQQEQRRPAVKWRTPQQQQQQPQQQPQKPSAAGGAVRPPLQAERPQWRPQGTPATGNSNGGSSSIGRRDSSRRQQHQQVLEGSASTAQQARQELQQIHRLALTAADAALEPNRTEGLDHRALVMVVHNLAKMQLYDSKTMQQLFRALEAGVLSQLDPQQLTNLIWSVGSCVSSAQEDRSPYKMNMVPAVLMRRYEPVVPVPAAAALTSSGTDAAVQGEVQWEQVAAVAEPAATDTSEEVAQGGAAGAAASSDVFADAVTVTAPMVWSSGTIKPPQGWLSAAADALLQQLPKCTSQGVAMAVWGFAQLGFSPPSAWWQQFWQVTQDSLPEYSAQDLALLMCGIGKLGPEVPSAWLSSYCSAACDVMPSMSSQQLTMCLWGLAVSGASPHKAFVLLWFLTSIGLMQHATTQELSMWLYALTLLRITPSPSWCAAFVEASYTRFTATDTRPQDLVTAMWSISRLAWSPPLLYWKGLLEAARERFERFAPLDLANCISAASVVDISCVSDAWLSAFLKASQTRLSAFQPVQLAHTANALALIVKSKQSAYGLITAAWQAAFVNVAAQHLAAGRFSMRNVVLVVTSLRLLQFKPHPDVQQFLSQAELVLAGQWPEQQQPVAEQLSADQVVQ